MLEAIQPEDRSDAMRLLQFLVHSKRPVRLVEAIEIIATDQLNGLDVDRRLFTNTEILEYCPGLITLVKSYEEELHLFYFSVKEYLIRKDQLKLLMAGISIIRTCLAYLTDVGGRYEDMKRTFLMVRYAAEIWLDYGSECESSSEVVAVISAFIQSEDTFSRWGYLY